jgi:hypothetical protein
LKDEKRSIKNYLLSGREDEGNTGFILNETKAKKKPVRKNTGF